MSSVRPSGSKRKGRQRKLLWISLLAVLIISSGGAAWYFFWGPGASAARSDTRSSQQTTYTSPVARGDLRVSAAGSGKLVAYRSVDLSFSTSGTLTVLNVKTGDTVKAGQVLASLGDSDTLKADLAKAELQVLNAKKALTGLHENADLSLAQSFADLAAAQHTYDNAASVSQRMAYARCGEQTTLKLAASLDNARQRLSTIHAEKTNSDVYIAAKKSYDTALANYEDCSAYSKNDKNDAASTLEVAHAALQEAQDRYDALKAASGIDPSELAMDQANLKLAQAQLADAREKLAGITITAPMDGKVTYLAAPAGARVGTDRFITLVDIDRAALEIKVDESDMARLVLDAPVIMTFDALPGQSFTGKVIQVNPEVTISGQYRVVEGLVELDQSAVKTISTLPIGLNASVTLNTQEALNALLVPAIALQKQGDNSYAVALVGGDGRIKMQKVTVGIHDNDYAEITSGLKEGDLVSTGTVKFVAAGSKTSSDALKNAQNAGGPPPGGMPGGGVPGEKP